MSEKHVCTCFIKTAKERYQTAIKEIAYADKQLKKTDSLIKQLYKNPKNAKKDYDGLFSKRDIARQQLLLYYTILENAAKDLRMYFLFIILRYI
jgi:rhamnose utilization protein RhaD (predicted bifunctional aldolase and dehydrogenase)